MKKFAIKILFFTLYFLLFSVIINSAFLAVIVYTDWDYIKRRETLNFTDPDYKMLVFGSSLAEYGVDAELLTKNGIKAFNFSMVGSSVKTCWVQMNEYLTLYEKKPEYVLLAVNSCLERFDQDGIQPVVEFTMQDHKYTLKDVPLSKFRWAGTEILKKVLKLHYSNLYVAHGQKRSFTVSPDYSQYTDKYLDIKKFESSIWMEEMARACSEHKIKFIIIDMPGVRETQNKSEVGPYILHFSKNDTAVLFNFNNQEFCKFIKGDKEWSGLSHFNSFGAAQFTRELIKAIENQQQ